MGRLFSLYLNAIAAVKKRPSAALEKSQLTPNAQDQETKPHLGIQAYLSILFYLFILKHKAYIKFFEHTRMVSLLE